MRVEIKAVTVDLVVDGVEVGFYLPKEEGRDVVRVGGEGRLLQQVSQADKKWQRMAESLRIRLDDRFRLDGFFDARTLP